METSLGKLQRLVDKQSKQIIELKDKLNKEQEKNKNLNKQIDYYKDHINEMVEKAIQKQLIPILEENKKLKEENEHLKRILNNDSNTTGIPTSKTPIGKEKRIPNSRKETNNSKGGQPGHKKSKLEKFNDNEITDTYTHEIANNHCSCGGTLLIIGKKEKDEFEIDIRLKKIRHEFMEYECSCCHKKINVPIPNNLKEDNQYGPKAQAMALALVNEGYVSFHRTKELISGFTNNEMNMSEGFIAKLQKRCFNKLSDFDKELHKKILSQKILHWDDTAISIDKKQSCLRFYGTEKLAYYKVHNKKDKVGLDEDGILSFLPSDCVVIHDHNIVNYNDEYIFTNAECCVHLIRDLRKLNDVLPREWIKELIDLLVTTNNKRKEYINQSIMYFDQEVTDKAIEKYDEILKQAHEINKKDFNNYYGNEEKKLIRRLEKYKDNYLLWILRFDVPFSNNLSERSLRSSKTKMKVSGQFSNIQNAEYFARIKSYIETCKRNGINIYDALCKLINDEPYKIENMKID